MYDSREYLLLTRSYVVYKGSLSAHEFLSSRTNTVPTTAICPTNSQGLTNFVQTLLRSNNLANVTIGVSPMIWESETFGIDVIFFIAALLLNGYIRYEDIVLFARKSPIWACQMFIHDPDINNPVKL